MSEVNWSKYDCDICRALSFVGAAIVAVTVAWILSAAGLPLWFVAVLFAVTWAALISQVDRVCEKLVAAAAHRAHQEQRSIGVEQENRSAATRDAGTGTGTGTGTEAKRSVGGEAAEPAVEDTTTIERELAPALVETPSEIKAAPSESDMVRGEVAEGIGQGIKPETMDGPRGGVADDLKRIKGIGPKLEQLCNELGFYHFDQIANWTPDEVIWVDSNLGGFNGRVARDDWIEQARVLAVGGETEFSKRVDDGVVPSSQ